MAVENHELIEATRSELSGASQDALRGVDSRDSEGVYKVLSTFKAVKNEFLDVLVNRIVAVKFYDKVFHNKLAMLHKGEIPFGQTIEQIFVSYGERKGFRKHFDDVGGSPEKDLLGKRVPNVYTNFISKNFEYKFKVSVSNVDLKNAFVSETGLSELTQRLILSNLNGAYIAEYRDMKGLLDKKDDQSSEMQDNGTMYGKGLIQRYVDNTQLKQNAVIKCGKEPRYVCEMLKAYAQKLTFPTNKYNLAEVETWTNTDELVFFTTPEISAKIDVNVLALAFNVSLTEVSIRTIVVDTLPKEAELGGSGTGLGDVIGVLADADLIQSWTTYFGGGDFFNPDSLMTNYFLHHQGIMALNPFAQAVVFTNGTI